MSIISQDALQQQLRSRGFQSLVDVVVHLVKKLGNGEGIMEWEVLIASKELLFNSDDEIDDEEYFKCCVLESLYMGIKDSLIQKIGCHYISKCNPSPGIVLQQQNVLEGEGWIFQTDFSELVGSELYLRVFNNNFVRGQIVAVLPGQFNGGCCLYLWKDSYTNIPPVCVTKMEIDASISCSNSESNEPYLRDCYIFLERVPLICSVDNCILRVFDHVCAASNDLNCSISDILYRLSNPSQHLLKFKFLSDSPTNLQCLVVDVSVVKYLFNKTQPENDDNIIIDSLPSEQKLLLLSSEGWVLAYFDTNATMVALSGIPLGIVNKLMYDCARGVKCGFAGFSFKIAALAGQDIKLLPPTVLRAIILLNSSKVLFSRFNSKQPIIMTSSILNEVDSEVCCLSLDDVYLARFPSLSVAKSILEVNISLVLACCVGILKSHGGFRWKRINPRNSAIVTDFRFVPHFANRCVGAYGNIPIADLKELTDALEANIHILPAANSRVNINSDVIQQLQTDDWSISVTNNEYIGMRVRRYFPAYGYSDATVVGYLPSTNNDGMALWHLIHDDSDEEDVELYQLLHALYNMHTAIPLFGSKLWRGNLGIAIDSSAIISCMESSNLSVLDGNSKLLNTLINLFTEKSTFAYSTNIKVRFLILLIYYLFVSNCCSSIKLCDALTFIEVSNFGRKIAISPLAILCKSLELLVQLGVCSRGGEICLPADITYSLNETFLLSTSPQSLTAKSVELIEAFRCRAGELRAAIVFSSLEEAATALKLDPTSIQKVLSGERQSLFGVGFRSLQSSSSTNKSEEKILEMRKFIESNSKRYARTLRTENSTNIDNDFDSTKSSKYVTFEPYSDAKIRVGQKYQAIIKDFRIPTIKSFRPSVTVVALTLVDTVITCNESRFNQALDAIFILGKMTLARTGTIVLVKRNKNEIVHACVTADYTGYLEEAKLHQLSFAYLSEVQTCFNDIPLIVFDGQLTFGVHWSDVVMTSQDDDIWDSICSRQGNCCNIYSTLLSLSNIKFERQWNFSEISALTSNNFISDDLGEVFRSSGLQTKSMKDMVRMFYEYHILFANSSSPYRGGHSDIDARSPSKSSVENLKLVIRHGSSYQTLIGQKASDAQCQESMNLSTDGLDAVNHQESSHNIDDIQDNSRTTKVGTKRKNSELSTDDLEVVPNSIISEHQICVDIRTTDNAEVDTSFRWVKRKKSAPYFTEDFDVATTDVICETRLDNLLANPFPYHFVILDTLSLNKSKEMELEELVSEIQRLFCGDAIYGRQHIIRSVERLILVGDLKKEIRQQEENTLNFVRITKTGFERHQKKRAEFEADGIIAQFSQLSRLANKYCCKDLITSILKYESATLTLRDLIHIMLKSKNYPMELYQIEKSFLIAVVKISLHALESQGIVQSASKGTPTTYLFNESAWRKSFLCHK